MRSTGVVGVVLLCALAGCTSATAQWTPGPIITESVTPAAQTPAPSPTGTATTAPKPTVPSTADALDVTAFESVHFASPTGRIWCAMEADFALCHFPPGMKTTKVPKPAKVCPEAGLDVTGVSVAIKVVYFCSGGAEALPQTNGRFVEWWRTSGFAAVKYDGQELATLPYGRKLVHRGYVCLSEEAGITCGNTASGNGFKVSRAGVTFIT